MRITTGGIIALKDGGRSRKTHFSRFLRHRDVLLCPVAALVQWLVFHWEIAREDVPVFANCSSWYETKLLPGSLKDPKKTISAFTQANWVKRPLGDSLIASSRVVHTMRKSVARLVDLMEVPADQLSPLRSTE